MVFEDIVLKLSVRKYKTAKLWKRGYVVSEKKCISIGTTNYIVSSNKEAYLQSKYNFMTYLVYDC